MIEASSLSRAGLRRLPVSALVVLVEATAAAVLAGALYLPWFQFSNPGTIVAVPAGSFGISFVDWQPFGFGVNKAQLLVGIGLYVSVGAVLLRILLRRGWTKVVLALGFLTALLGSVAAYGEMDSVLVLVPADSAIAPGIGMWLFAAAAAVGLVAAGIDRGRLGRPRS